MLVAGVPLIAKADPKRAQELSAAATASAIAGAPAAPEHDFMNADAAVLDAIAASEAAAAAAAASTGAEAAGGSSGKKSKRRKA